VDATVVWKNGMSFTGTGLTSNFSLPLGASPKVGGANDGFRPLELLLVGLAGCTAMDVVSILEKKRIHVTAFEVKAHGDQADEHPRWLTRFEVEYIVTGKARRAAEPDEVLLRCRHAAPRRTDRDEDNDSGGLAVEAGFLDLVDQRATADAQLLCGMRAVPAVSGQRLCDELPFLIPQPA